MAADTPFPDTEYMKYQEPTIGEIISKVNNLTAEQIESIVHYQRNNNVRFGEAAVRLGLLTERGAPSWHPAPAALKRLARKAVYFCKSKGVSIEQLAVSYSTANPRIATTLFSSASPENVKRTISYAGLPLDWELLVEVQTLLEPAFRDSWVNS